ncbi:MAG: penicillin-binding protein 2, partial [Campylobacterota bacterium]|nr:penicillin-binding protein 2 [Campylobacterota bacterium]
MINKNRSKKILFLFIILILGFGVFLSVMFMNAFKSRKSPSLYTSESTRAQRGSIISADGFHIATTQKLYKAMVNTKNIDPEKKELFIELFSIYSGLPQDKIRKKISARRGTVVLSYSIGPKVAQYLKSLAFELLKYKVFVEYEGRHGERILQGLSIIESGETREYPYGKLLTPLIGYPHKIEDDGYTRVYGVKGIEKRFDDELDAQKNGKQFALRDVNSYMILNKQSYTQSPIHGFDIKLNIPVTLQIKIEEIVEHYKKELRANEVFITLMESKTGKIISLASSNRFYPKAIQRSDYPSLNTSAIEYSFESGSVIKPITFALLLDKKLINPYDLVNGHNGRFKVGKKTITDEHKFDWMGAEDVIVYSSNVGIAQLAQKLSGIDFYDGFNKFGLTQLSGVDLPYERKGHMPNIRQLNHDIYKATTGYGYGILSNLMQLVKAYNIFNNSGRMLTPYIVEGTIDQFGRMMKREQEAPVQVISTATAERMKKILIKTVNQGTGIKTRTEGVQVGGKTGTSHIAEKGRYVNKYNSSFIGFANDEKHKYTLGVTVIQPRSIHFASLTAVPVFKAIVDTLIDEGYLNPDSEKFPLP